MRRLALAGVLTAVTLMASAGPASAHPLGNFTVNVYSGLRVQPDRVVVDLVVDMAEIPAFQARPTVDADGDGKITDGESEAYAGGACAQAAGRVTVATGGRPASVRATAGQVSFPPGAAGLATLRLTCVLVADTGEVREDREVTFRNAVYDDRVGWREVTAVGDGTTLAASDVRATSLSARLTAYPGDLLSSPPDQRVATVRARPGGPAAPEIVGIPAPRISQARGVDAATRWFTTLVGRQQLTPLFALVALALALVLGAVHALAPGHGKTVMAAYLVGQQGSMRQAGVIALTVTATHTAGVLVLGIVLSASTGLAPETLYPWLGLASGLLLAGIGASLLARALHRQPALAPKVLVGVGGPDRTAGGPAGEPGHPDGHPHSHDRRHGHPHGHSHGDQPVAWRTLVPMGLAGGMVPSPSALVVLLGAIALGRAWFGVVLVVAYGLGMAATLTGAGLLLVRARGAIERRMKPGQGRALALTSVLPALTAGAIIAAGLFLAARGAAQL